MDRPRRHPAEGRPPVAAGDRQTVQEYCAERLAKFKVPSDITVIEALPRNATGKVLKRELRDEFVGEHAPKIS